MQIKASEIADILRRQIEGYETTIDMAEVGTVISVGDGIARVYGLDGAMAGELIDFGHDIYGIALNLEEDNVGCVLMGESQHVGEGDEVRRTREIMQLPVGPALVGRVVDPLGRPLDGKGAIESPESYPHRADRPGCGQAPAGEGTNADGDQGHRLHDSDRSWPARAHHR